jgi:hypothetical protein
VQATLLPDEDADDAVGPQPNQFYILDGPQRLTSIVRVFSQASPDEAFYFDSKKLREFDSAPSKTDWIVKRAKTTVVANRFLRSEVIIDQERCQELVEEYFEAYDDDLRNDRPRQRRASARVNGIFETIRNYQVPCVVIDRRTEPLEAICRIFETINSTGTRLTTFDLAVARFFPEPDLQPLWEESRQQFDILRDYEVDGERVLQVAASLESASRQAAGGDLPTTEVTRTVLLNLPKEVVRTRWHDAVRWLVEAYQWALDHGVARGMFPNEALMVPLAVFLAKVDAGWKRTHNDWSAVLDRWFFASCLQQGARQASNYRVSEATSQLLRWLRDGTLPEIPRVFLTPAQVLRLRSTDSRYRAIMAFMRWQMKTDLWDGEPLDPLAVHDHHIFPAALAKRNSLDRAVLDSVSNRLLVSQATNKLLSARNPQDYLVAFLDQNRKSGTLPARQTRLRSACIVLPDDRTAMLAALDVTQAVSFVKGRAEHICDALKGLLGDSFVPDDSDEE